MTKNLPAVQETTCNTGNPGSIPRLGRFPGEENGNPLQYSCLKNPMDRGAWWATVPRVARVRHNLVTKPHTHHTHTHTHTHTHFPPFPTSHSRSSERHTGLSALCSNFSLFDSVYMSALLSQFIPPLPSPCPQVHSLDLCFHAFPANRFISAFFLDSMN